MMLRTKKVVVNASPIIVLFKAGLEHILPELFDIVVVPDLVINEIKAGTDSLSNKINTVKWLSVIKVVLDENIVEWNLGKGETAVISYALKNSEFKAVIDDKAARKCAKTNSLKIFGTGHLLVFAARQGLIVDFDKALNEVKKSGLWISDDICQILKSKI